MSLPNSKNAGRQKIAPAKSRARSAPPSNKVADDGIVREPSDADFMQEAEQWAQTHFDDLEAVDMLLGDSEEQRIAEQRELEKHLAESDAVKADINLSFGQLCKRLNVPFEFFEIYYEWLLMQKNSKGEPRFKKEWLPRQRGKYLKPGIKVPPPYGEVWEQLVNDRGRKWKSKYIDWEAAQNVERVMHCVMEAMRAATAFVYEDKTMSLETDPQKREVLIANRVTIEANKAKKRRDKAKSKAVDSDLPECPKSTKQALYQENREEAYEWLNSVLKEWNGLDELGVFEHNFTRQELRDRGVTSTPVPLTEALEYKFGKDGKIDRRKTRYPLSGHPGNMQKNVHYKETFAPTPSQNSSRLLVALMVLYDLVRKCGDISQAYCLADLPEEEAIAVRYPSAFKRFHPKTGEELFAMLRKSLYGHPAAGRYWDKWRNQKILLWFNKRPWKAKRSIREPSLVIITRGDEWALVLTHTDDIDSVGTSTSIVEDIFSKLREEWEVRDTDPSFMLGVERNIPETEDGTKECELKMTAFVDGMMETFKEWKTEKTMHTPVKEDLFISKPVKLDASSEAKAKEIIARGGQTLLGMLLWAARCCYPECLLGTSMLGRVMARPTEEFWNNAVHMMNYMYQNRHRGIKFSSTGNRVPVAHVDASNKPDPSDGKCQYGFDVMLAGGPIIAVSKKLSHIGLSAAHNEYMALHWCNRQVMWLRQLLTEIGLRDMVKEPTIVRGDNKAANTLCYEDIVTTGNQFIYTPYHYNKEVCAMKEIQVMFIRSPENTADVMTKATKRGVHRYLAPKLTGYEVFTDDDATFANEEKAQVS